jgi:hypothetical protein
MNKKILEKLRALPARIKAGEAEPISDREREQLEEMKQLYIKRFGNRTKSKI